MPLGLRLFPLTGQRRQGTNQDATRPGDSQQLHPPAVSEPGGASLARAADSGSDATGGVGSSGLSWVLLVRGRLVLACASSGARLGLFFLYQPWAEFHEYEVSRRNRAGNLGMGIAKDCWKKSPPKWVGPVTEV